MKYFYNISIKDQESPKSVFNWAAKGDFSWVRCGCTRSGHRRTLSLTIAWHSISCKWFKHCTLWKTIAARKMSTIFKSGLYSNYSNSTIMNKNKQVSLSKQEPISITNPSPNPCPPPPQTRKKYDSVTWLIWPNRKFQKMLSFYRS